MINIYKLYREAFQILAQQVDEEFDKDPDVLSPEIKIEPQDDILTKATQILKTMNPSYFVGVKKIVVNVSNAYGNVQSGGEGANKKNPYVVNINEERIKSENKENAILACVLVIAHEVGHIRSYDKKMREFVGGESTAEAEEKKVETWIKSNEDKIKPFLN